MPNEPCKKAPNALWHWPTGLWEKNVARVVENSWARFQRARDPSKCHWLITYEISHKLTQNVKLAAESKKKRVSILTRMIYDGRSKRQGTKVFSLYFILSFFFNAKRLLKVNQLLPPPLLLALLSCDEKLSWRVTDISLKTRRRSRAILAMPTLTHSIAQIWPSSGLIRRSIII